MSMEGYKPTEEDIKKGESMMTREQEIYSNQREEQAKRLKDDLGVDGYLEYTEEKDGEYYITGKINGHIVSINVEKYSSDYGNIISGKIDDVEIGQQEYNKFLRKYGNYISSPFMFGLKQAGSAEEIKKAFVMEEIGL